MHSEESNYSKTHTKRRGERRADPLWGEKKFPTLRVIPPSPPPLADARQRFGRVISLHPGIVAAQRAVSSLHRDLDVVLGMCVFTAAVRPNRWFDTVFV